MKKRNDLSCLFIFFGVIFFISCDTDSDDDIPKNLFPLGVGLQWNYNVEERDLNDNPIPGKGGTIVKKVVRSSSLKGKNCFEVIDSIYISDMGSEEKNSFHIDSKGNIWQFLLFESSDTASGPGWLKVINREKGFNRVHTILNTTIQPSGSSVSVKIKSTSVIRKKEPITVPLGTFSDAYPIETNILMQYDTVTVNLNHKGWLVNNIGPVKRRISLSDDFGKPVTKYRIESLVRKNF